MTFQERIDEAYHGILTAIEEQWESDGRRYQVAHHLALRHVVASEQDWKCISCKIPINITGTFFPVSIHYGPSGDKVKPSHLHHRDRNHKNDNRDNLEMRCFTCHQLLHRHQRNPQLKLRSSFLPEVR